MRVSFVMSGTLAILALLVSAAPATRARATTDPQVLFGIGPEADSARATQLVREAPVKLLTSWYNGPSDLAWLKYWRDGLIPDAYAAGYAMSLVVFSGDAARSLSTPYGPACGRAYPLSHGFLDDMTQLAKIFAGSGPLYVSLFAEFQTYPCQHDQWAGNENYYRALKDQYTSAKAIFHQFAPNARVSLCWGGWQTRWDDPGKGGGSSLFGYFSDVMAASDFQSFQAMQSDSNVSDVRNMTKTLHAWGPVMLAYYKPDNESPATFDADTRAMLTSGYLAEVTADGLFAWSFMDNNNLAASAASYQFVRAAVTRYAAPWIVPPTSAAPPPPAATPSPSQPIKLKLGQLYNNAGISDDADTVAGNLDGGGYSYSAQALHAAGVGAGQSVTLNGVTFQWPNVVAGVPDNVAARGQTVSLDTSSAHATLHILGAANHGPATGIGTIHYTDDSSQSFSLTLSDWTLNGGTAQPSPGNSAVVTLPYRNGAGGRDGNHHPALFSVAVPLQGGKTVTGITLPDQPNLHIFALSLG